MAEKIVTEKTMTEKIVKGKKNGMAVLLFNILLVCASFYGVIVGGLLIDEYNNPIIFIASLVTFTVTCFVWAGLKVLKPQEALVLTLFGKYVGTLKEPGFYYVNPFCSAVNPASKTQLNQSGDVKTKNTTEAAEVPSKKIADIVAQCIVKFKGGINLCD